MPAPRLHRYLMLRIYRQHLSLLFFRTHFGEEQYFLNSCLTGHQHHQTVDTDTDTGCRRHTELQCAQEVLVDEHRFVVPFFAQLQLILETFFLVDRVVQLRCKAFANSFPFTINSKRSVSPGLLRCILVSGLISTG